MSHTQIKQEYYEGNSALPQSPIYIYVRKLYNKGHVFHIGII